MSDVTAFNLLILLGLFLSHLDSALSVPVTPPFQIPEVCNEGMKPCPNSNECRLDLKDCPTEPLTQSQSITDSTTFDLTTNTVHSLSESTDIALTLYTFAKTQTQSTVDAVDTTVDDVTNEDTNFTTSSTEQGATGNDGLPDSTTDPTNETTDDQPAAESTSQDMSESFVTDSPMDAKITTVAPESSSELSTEDDHNLSNESTHTTDSVLVSSASSDWSLGDEMTLTPSWTYSSEPRPGESANRTVIPISNSIILVFKGVLTDEDKFKMGVRTDLARHMTLYTSNNVHHSYAVFILNVKCLGPDNQTVTTELSVLENSTVARLVSPSEILVALSMKKEENIFTSMVDDLEFICAYLSKEKPCTDLNVDKTSINGGLFEQNKHLFIAIFGVASLFLALLIFGLIYIRCRQRRRSSTYVTNVSMEKTNLTKPSEYLGINNPLSDKEILREEMETSLNQNGAPLVKAEDGWIVPLDQMPERRNSNTIDTRL